MKLGKIKKILIITLAVTVGAFSQGCSGAGDDTEVVNNIDDEEFDEEEVDEEDVDGEEVAEEEDEEEQIETQRVGDSEQGFIDIPAAWLVMSEDEYSNKEGTTLITLLTHRDPEIDAKSTAEKMYQNMEEQGIEMQAEEGRFGEYEAIAMFAENTEADRIGFLWFFEAEEGHVNTVTVEGPKEDAEYISKIVGLVESSFSLVE